MHNAEFIDFPLYGADGSHKGTCGLPVWLFGGEVNHSLLHQVTVAFMANERQGTAATKNKALVSGGGKKPWRQKGTGRARAGSTRSPIWRHGGIIFGPTPRSYRQKVTKKMKRGALISAFSARAKEDRIAVFEIPEFEKPRTRVVHGAIRKMGADEESVLLLTSGAREGLLSSSRNIPWLRVKPFGQVNCLDVMKAKRILIDKDVIDKDLKTGATDGLSQDH
jgi:large subunit ribosomal protein L4